MQTNIKGVFISIKGNGEIIPYCNFNVIDKFITYLQRNNLIKDFSYQDFINFLGQLGEIEQWIYRTH